MKPIHQFHSSRRNDFDFPPAYLRPKALLTDYNFQTSAFGPFGRPGSGNNRRNSSIHLISRKFFRREFIVEAFVFGVLVLISVWPIAYLIQTLMGLIR